MIELRLDGDVARLSLARPEARNAIALAGWSEIAAAVEQAEQAGARLLILAGTSGGPFCAGADVSGFDRFRHDPEARTEFRRAIREGLDRLRKAAFPTVAVIEGACYGAGVAVAMACDIRLAGPGARFAITPAKLGISYPQEDVHRLVALVGPGQAARLLFSADPIDAAEAARIGLVELHVEEGLEEALDGLVASIRANDGASLEVLKRAVALAVEGRAGDEGQDRAFDDLLGSDILFERLTAYRSRPKG